MGKDLRLTRRELALLSEFKLDLGSPDKWHKDIRICSIGPFDNHIVDRYQTLNRNRHLAIVSGIKLALATINRLAIQLRESKYPLDFVLMANISDDWFLKARTPPEIIFVAGDDSTLRNLVESGRESLARLEPSMIDCDFVGDSVFENYSWVVSLPEPLAVEDRFFLRVIYPSRYIAEYFEVHPIRTSVDCSLVVNRVFRVLTGHV